MVAVAVAAALAVREAEGAALALDGPEGLAAVARDERDGRRRHLDERAVAPVLGGLDDALARALLDEPPEVVLAALAVRLVPDEA